MPTATKQSKPPVKKPAGAQQNQRQKLVEEFATLDREIEQYKPKIFRHEKLRGLILDWYRAAPGEDEITVPGITCDVLISGRDEMRTVTLKGRQKLFALWGQKGYIAKSKVLLKSLPDPKDEEGLYTEQSMTGPRHLHVIARPKAALNAA